MSTLTNPMAELHRVKDQHRALDNRFRLYAAIKGPTCRECDKAGDDMAALDPVIAQLENDARSIIEHRLAPEPFTAADLRELYA